MLQESCGFDDAAYGWMNFAFTAGYAVMYVFAGRFIDYIGARERRLPSPSSSGRSRAWAIRWCRGVGFAVARFILAMGEAANFPAAIKTTAQWFPKKERAFATGLFNSGSNIGLMLTPLIAYMAAHLGWQSAFIATGLVGLLWLAWWLVVYAPPSHRRVSPTELQYIVGKVMRRAGVAY